MAGVLISLPGVGVVVATSGAQISLAGVDDLEAIEKGRFAGADWRGQGAVTTVSKTRGDTIIELPEPSVVLLRR